MVPTARGAQYANIHRQCHQGTAERSTPSGETRPRGSNFSRTVSPIPDTPDPHPDAEPLFAERRGAQDRRTNERRQLTLVPSEERRTGEARRRPGDRRASPRVRDAETAEEHVRNAVQLLMTIAETDAIDDEVRRDLDAAIFRLHFAIERLRRSSL